MQLIDIQYLKYKSKYTCETWMENIVGQSHNQLVCNKANSLEGGQFI